MVTFFVWMEPDGRPYAEGPEQYVVAEHPTLSYHLASALWDKTAKPLRFGSIPEAMRFVSQNGCWRGLPNVRRVRISPIPGE